MTGSTRKYLVVIGILLAAAGSAVVTVGILERQPARRETAALPTAAAEKPEPTAPATGSFPALPVTANPTAERQALVAQMRAGYAQAAPGAPNIIDLLADRFPADFDGMMQEISALSPPSPSAMQRIVAKTLVTIQARDGTKLALEHAPGAALRQLMTAERDVIAAAVADGSISCTTVARAPTPDIARLSIIRLYALLTAIAEGRDHPVDRAEAAPADYTAFARAAMDRGDDVGQWKGISDPDVAAKEPARVCRGLLSMYAAAVKTDGALGERIIAALTADQLATSLSAYQPVLK